MVLVRNYEQPSVASRLESLLSVYLTHLSRPMDMTRKRFKFTFDPKDTFCLSIWAEQQWFVQSLEGPSVESHRLTQLLLGTVELQWLEHLWNHENMFQTKVV